MNSVKTDVRRGDRHKPRSGDRHKNRPAKWQSRIIGIDGEGWGVDEHGRQNYMLMVAASDDGFAAHLHTGSRLTTHECLNFIWTLPVAHLTSYVFSYDVSQIFRDIPHDIRNAIFDNGFDWPPVTWEGWGLQYVGHKMLTISRFGKGSVTVYDAIGFWQQSYLKTLQSNPGINPKLIKIVERGKARRGGDTADWREELEYSTAECSTLATVQRNVYMACKNAGYPLSSFYGAGSLAKSMLRKNNAAHAIGPATLGGRRSETEERRLEWFLDRAYFGGRFETVGNGYIPRVHMADIHNAYPHAATLLPCLHDAKLNPTRIKTLPLPTGVYEIEWETKEGIWGPLPQRDKHGRPTWPMRGHTIAYSPEINAASLWPNVTIRVISGYRLNAVCDCRPFEWLHDAYRKRLAYKRAGDPREKVLKLGPNAVYGALAQNVGQPKYRSLFDAGMITSLTRAKLLNMILTNPDTIAVATDSAWSTSPIVTKFSDELGAWGDEGHADDVWLIQPGLACSEHDMSIVKTRGVPRARMAAKNADGLTAWDILRNSFREKWRTDEPISVDVETVRYIGLGLAKNMRDPYAAGRWENTTRNIRFGSEKRPLFKASESRDLWRDSMPVNIGHTIYAADKSIYKEEMLEMFDNPEPYDDITGFTARLGE